MIVDRPAGAPVASKEGTRRDRGSATVWVLACCALVLVIGMVVTARTTAVLLRHRAESAADLAALAGAGRIGVGGAPCDAAGRVAGDNGAGLIACQAVLSGDGRSGSVRVVVRVSGRLPLVGARSVEASARAGRDPPSG